MPRKKSTPVTKSDAILPDREARREARIVAQTCPSR